MLDCLAPCAMSLSISVEIASLSWSSFYVLHPFYRMTIQFLTCPSFLCLRSCKKCQDVASDPGKQTHHPALTVDAKWVFLSLDSASNDLAASWAWPVTREVVSMFDPTPFGLESKLSSIAFKVGLTQKFIFIFPSWRPPRLHVALGEFKRSNS